MKSLRSLGLATVAVLLLAGVLSAQAPTAGRIIGTISDDQGGPLPGVSVEARSPRLVGTAATVSDTNGAYRLLALPPGTYTVSFSLQGFGAIVRNDIVLGVEQALVVDISMKPSAVEEEVVVIGQAPLIDVKNAARGQVLTAQTFQALPKGRSFDSLVTIMPGVQSENDLLSGISVDGASGAENMFYVDGTDTSDLMGGTRKQNVVFDFAEEVQFKASGYNAEFGGSVGGVVNVITRSGGNNYHGEVVGYYSGTALEGRRRDRLSLDLDDDTRARYYPYEEYVGRDTEHAYEAGFLLGGFLVKDRLWFFGALTPSLFQRDRAMDMAIQGGTGVNAYQRTERTWNASFKLSAQPLKNLRAGASFIMNIFKYKGGSDPMTFPADQTYAALSNASGDYNNLGYSYPNYSATAYADLTLSNNALLSVRGGYFFNNQNDRIAPLPTTPYYAFRLEQPGAYAFVSNDMFPEIPADLRHPAGWQNFPRANVMGLEQRMDSRLSLNSDFTYYLNFGGEHALKVGAQFMRRSQNVNDAAQQPIVFLGWDQDLIAYGMNYGRGAYGYYGVRGFADAGPYGEDYKVNMNSWSLYLQDSWTIARRLTLNLGLRAEAEYLPSYTTDPAFAGIEKPVNFSFADKLAPRLGFAYDVLRRLQPQGLRQLRHLPGRHEAQHGRQRPGRPEVEERLLHARRLGLYPDRGRRQLPRHAPLVVDFRPPLFDVIDPDMKPFTQREISLGVEKKLAEDTSLSVRLVNKKVLWAIEDIGVPIEMYYYSQSRQRVYAQRLRRMPGERPAPAGNPRFAQGQAGLLRHEPVPREALQQQLAGRALLHAQPAHRQLQRPGQLRRGRPQFAERGALLRHVAPLL